MPSARIVRTSSVARSPRVLQLEGLFEIPPTRCCEVAWQVHLPIEDHDWNVGLIVGPSGSGKSTVARELFGAALITDFDWRSDRSMVDDFPDAMGIKEITALLSSVGFSSPPAWLRPFAVLSNGERFRVTIARALAESSSLVVADEFTSVVDRTVARIGSAAVAKAIRRRKRRFIAVTCHYDVIDWLQPDWMYEPATNSFTWRSVRPRPGIELEVRPACRDAWRTFEPHHYLSRGLNPAARRFLGTVQGEPAAFTAVLYFPHPTRPGWREHRTVCLPDFQGVGIGNAMSEFVAGLYRATGKPYRSVTANPAMVHHRARSPCWNLCRAPSRSGRHEMRHLRKTSAHDRITASFEYVGPARPEDARRFAITGAPRYGPNDPRENNLADS